MRHNTGLFKLYSYGESYKRTECYESNWIAQPTLDIIQSRYEQSTFRLSPKGWLIKVKREKRSVPNERNGEPQDPETE